MVPGGGNPIVSFGDWLRQRRQVLGLTQAALARQIGCAVITIKKIEHDERRPSQQMAELLAERLAIPAAARRDFMRMARGQFVPASAALDTPAHLPDFLQQDTRPAPLDQPPFVAREGELARLKAQLDMAVTGNSRVAFIVGEAGQGKTALLGEFARQAQLAYATALVASGSCNAYSGVGDPYLPFRDILDMLCGNIEAKWTAGMLTRDHAGRLWTALPYTLQALIDDGPDLLEVFVSGAALLQRAAALPEADIADRLLALMDRRKKALATPRQPQLFEQYTNVLRRLAARQPLILLLDDAQWIDEASLHLLFHLGQRLAGSRVLIIGAYRLSDLAARSADHPQRLTLEEVTTELQRRFGDIQIDLTRLEAAEERHFVEALLDREPNGFDEVFRAELFRLTRGHPLFTIELLHSLQERGDLIRDEAGRWQARPGLTWDALPARVEAVIAQRLLHLGGELRDLLRVASVEGEDFTAEVLSAVLHLDEQQTLRMLSGELAQRQRLVRERGEMEIGRRFLTRYQFSHALFQQYLYQGLSAPERRQLHQQVAQALETLYEDQLDDIAVQLAHHFMQAAVRDKAAQYLRRAGDRARRSAAFAEAGQHYRAALERWDAADTIGQAELLRALGECSWALGELHRAINTFQEVYDRYRALHDSQNAGAAQRIMGRLYWEASDRARSTQHYQQALAILEPFGDSVELARVYGGLSSIYRLATELAEALAWGERALALGERLGAEDVIVQALRDIGTTLYYTQPERGLALIQESLRRALAADLPHDVCRSYANVADTLHHLNRHVEARDVYQSFVAYAERFHMGMYVHYARAELFHLEWLQGDWSAWQRHQPLLTEFLKEDANLNIGAAFAGAYLGQAYNDLGRAEAAWQVLELTLSPAQGAAETQTTLPHLGELARAYAGLGQTEKAMSSAADIIAWVERVALTHPNSIMALRFACQYAAEHRLTDLARRGLRQLERTLKSQHLVETAASVSEVRGCVALMDNEIDRAVASLRSALRQWTAQERPYDQLRTLNGLSRALIAAGDEGGARTACNQAGNLLEVLAAPLDAVELKASFFDSVLAQEIKARRDS